MKKTKKVLKLNLNKFAVARIQNLQSIIGGNQETTTGTKLCPSNPRHNPLCTG